MRRRGYIRVVICLATIVCGCGLSGQALAEDDPASDASRPTEINPLRIGSRPRTQTGGRWVEWRAGAKWQGEYVDGKRDGIWEGTVPLNEDAGYFGQPAFADFTSPLTITVALDRNVPHGEISATDAEGRPVIAWHFDQGVLEGRATWWHANGQTRRQVTYRAGLLDGPATEWNADGKVTTQETYREGRGSGSHIDWFEPGLKRYEGYSHLPGEVMRDSFDWQELAWSQAAVHEYSSEERCGRWTAWYPNGQKSLQGSYQDDEPEGHFTWWHTNGQKRAEGEYLVGKRHGLWRWWHANGRKQLEGEYQHGQPTGDWEAWSADGRSAVVDRSKAELALDWDEPATVSTPATRGTAPTRPTRSAAASTSGKSSSASSLAPTARSSPTASPRSAASITTKTGSLSPRSRASNSSPTRGERSASASPAWARDPVSRQTAPQPTAPSDEFTLLGALTSPGGTSKPTTRRGPAPVAQHNAPQTRDRSGNIIANAFGLQPAPPPARTAKPVRR